MTLFSSAKGIFFRREVGSRAVAQARSTDDTHCETAGYENEFASVRRVFARNKGTYTCNIDDSAPFH